MLVKLSYAAQKSPSGWGSWLIGTWIGEDRRNQGKNDCNCVIKWELVIAENSEHPDLLQGWGNAVMTQDYFDPSTATFRITRITSLSAGYIIVHGERETWSGNYFERNYDYAPNLCFIRIDERHLRGPEYGDPGCGVRSFHKADLVRSGS
jgi:hypothetical protein